MARNARGAIPTIAEASGVQFGSGNLLDVSTRGRREGVQVVNWLLPGAQHFPDSPNHPTFPAIILNPSRVLSSRSVYRFGVE